MILVPLISPKTIIPSAAILLGVNLMQSKAILSCTWFEVSDLEVKC